MNRPLVKETRSVTMNSFFEKNIFFFIICKNRIKLYFHKVNYLIKKGIFLLLVIIYVPPKILDS